MDNALAQAELGLGIGNSPVGAVLATPFGEFEGYSTEAVEDDLRKHAEMNAYEKAQPHLGMDLSQSSLFTTLSPCGMCFSLVTQGRVGAIYIAAEYGDVPDFVRPRDYDFDKMLRSAGRSVLVVVGLRKERAIKLMTPANKRHKSAGQA
jgi:tRNA(Arg) A34 adenosine deaminase TadA